MTHALGVFLLSLSLFVRLSSESYANKCDALLKEVGNPTNTAARFNQAEWPYHRPKGMKVYGTTKPFNVKDLEIGKRYLWVIDAEGNIRIARERAFEHNPPSASNPSGRDRIQHRDLLAKTKGFPAGFSTSTYVPDLAPARLGGELVVRKGPNGELKIEFNTKSAYTPGKGIILPLVREDGEDRTGQEPLEAARDYFIELSKEATPLKPENFTLVPFNKAL